MTAKQIIRLAQLYGVRVVRWVPVLSVPRSYYYLAGPGDLIWERGIDSPFWTKDYSAAKNKDGEFLLALQCVQSWVENGCPAPEL